MWNTCILHSLSSIPLAFFISILFFLLLDFLHSVLCFLSCNGCFDDSCVPTFMLHIRAHVFRSSRISLALCGGL
ncbi:predicted protein [Plenodomus lingam JN3]|uniref:Predicted protein n=1 Tax=Leptosphaeria maculans (strain JN3 / isolate v23.1.3 / race Av1-4-5-6-7-8) TaxID=985895 RepID=E5A1Y3_LEPMJ|nr:predicted protein [Plenodomus lingam JN3]CBX97700.1 predicted protein [Plenodomus lingam JN3]